MNVTPITIRTLSMLGQRGAFGTALVELAATDQRICAVSADLCNTSGLDRFAGKYPNRFYNTGIAEQNMIGIAAGLASVGKIPFATTFANFGALRGCEQVRHFLGYMRENVKLVGFGSGFSFGFFGTTHYGTEDVAALRAINNLVLLSPADCLEVVKATEAASRIDAPVYLRLSGVMNNPAVYKTDYDFQIGKAVLMKEGADILLIATGSMVHTALKAAEELEKNDCSVGVLNMHTIKPLDEEAVVKLSRSARVIVTVEEHSSIGGLGSAVAEVLSANRNSPPLVRIGTKPEYLHAGDYKYMLDAHGLTPAGVVEAIKKVRV